MVQQVAAVTLTLTLPDIQGQAYRYQLIPGQISLPIISRSQSGSNWSESPVNTDPLIHHSRHPVCASVDFNKGEMPKLTCPVEHLLWSLQNVKQLLMVVLIVFFAIFPQIQRLLLILHKCVPGVGEVQRLHHPQFTASSMQGLQPSLDLCFLPLKKASCKDAQLYTFSGLQHFSYLCRTSTAGTGRHIPRRKKNSIK